MYAVTLALTDSESKVFGTKETWQNNNSGLARDGVALLVVEGPPCSI
ncbi:hypothetical protein EJG51_009180 [Undibacterium piscinae]|uniref:Uncharacterized protein n=1 Tax=Undibacterium piscinae TaxID=2495591 RepID=A0A6M4A5Z8_9BURK|nr:hypothetical protein EJG51_009180 [Undibacterium piscinae]